MHQWETNEPFRRIGVYLSFASGGTKDDGLDRHVVVCADRSVRNRGLRSIIENVMLDIMFDLPDQPRGSRYVISEDVVEGQKPLFEQPQTKSA
jgi:ATP-dependent Clp protease ATP-binding subunit ClpX